jgi:hypothetical protein
MKNESTTPERYTVEKDGRRWYVLDHGVRCPNSFTTKKAAQIDADASNSSAAADAAVEKVQPIMDAAAAAQGSTLTDDVVASLDRAARIIAANPEKDALAAWRANGQQGDRPSTPILDWFADPNSKPARKVREGGTGKRTVVDETLAPVVRSFVESGRAAGKSWKVLGAEWAALAAGDGPEKGVSLSEHQLYSMAKADGWAV